MMGNREDFEKWARDQGISLLPAPFQIGTFSNQVTEMAFRAWQARQPEIDAKSNSMSVSPTFQKIAMRHHESLEAAIDAAMKEAK